MDTRKLLEQMVISREMIAQLKFVPYGSFGVDGAIHHRHWDMAEMNNPIHM